MGSPLDLIIEHLVLVLRNSTIHTPREARIRAKLLTYSPDSILIYAYTLFATEGSLLVIFIRGESRCPYTGLNTQQKPWPLICSDVTV